MTLDQVGYWQFSVSFLLLPLPTDYYQAVLTRPCTLTRWHIVPWHLMHDVLCYHLRYCRGPTVLELLCCMDITRRNMECSTCFDVISTSYDKHTPTWYSPIEYSLCILLIRRKTVSFDPRDVPYHASWFWLDPDSYDKQYHSCNQGNGLHIDLFRAVCPCLR